MSLQSEFPRNEGVSPDNRLVKGLADTLNLSEPALNNIIWSLVAIVVVLVGRRVAKRLVRANVEEHEAEYRASKIVNYMATATFLIWIAFIWVDAFDNLPTYLGLVSAGIAIALSDVLKNMAGWVYILGRKPLQVGDRIEVNGIKGDVVDIRLFRFTLMEIDGWVDAEQSTGRLVHVPNGLLFNHELANYTEGFAYIWHELPVLVTFESDWKLAEILIRGALDDGAPDISGPAGERIRETAHAYSIRVGTLTPTVYLTVRDSGVLLTARYLVEARTRRGREDRVWRSILEAFAEHDSIQLAYPTIRAFLPDTVAVNQN